MDLDVELSTLTGLLGLEEFEVVEASLDRGRTLRRLTLVPRTSVGRCPHCQGISAARHACHERLVSDLPMGSWRVELVVRLWQFHCRGCDRFFTPRLGALAEGSHATERLLERLAELASHSDVATAARFFGLAQKTAEGWYYAYLQRQVESPVKHLLPVESLGIDELSFKKDTASSADFDELSRVVS